MSIKHYSSHIYLCFYLSLLWVWLHALERQISDQEVVCSYLRLQTAQARKTGKAFQTWRSCSFHRFILVKQAHPGSRITVSSLSGLAGARHQLIRKQTSRARGKVTHTQQHCLFSRSVENNRCRIDWSCSHNINSSKATPTQCARMGERSKLNRNDLQVSTYETFGADQIGIRCSSLGKHHQNVD